VLIFLNGRLVPEHRARVSVFDRGFLYGDGLFETVRVCQGRPFRWAQHLERFQRGAEFLGIRPPFTPGEWLAAARRLIVRNRRPEALLRLTLSRGVGVRGYSPAGADSPTLMLSLHPLPGGPAPKWKLITTSHRLPPATSLARFKTANKLAQILARAEADTAGADEALLRDARGRIAEGTAGNLFWISRDAVCTPPLAAGILPGVTRAVVLEICRDLKIKVRERSPRPGELAAAQGVFLTLSSRGIVEAVALDGRPLRRSPVTRQLRQAHERLLHAETA
jgi:branched-chain amino acid aminotransferase